MSEQAVVLQLLQDSRAIPPAEGLHSMPFAKTLNKHFCFTILRCLVNDSP